MSVQFVKSVSYDVERVRLARLPQYGVCVTRGLEKHSKSSYESFVNALPMMVTLDRCADLTPGSEREAELLDADLNRAVV